MGQRWAKSDRVKDSVNDCVEWKTIYLTLIPSSQIIWIDIDLSSSQ